MNVVITKEFVWCSEYSWLAILIIAGVDSYVRRYNFIMPLRLYLKFEKALALLSHNNGVLTGRNLFDIKYYCRFF